MPIPEPIVTNRLILRPFMVTDAAEVEVLAGAVQIADTTKLIPHPYPSGEALRWIETHQYGFNTGEQHTFAVTKKVDGLLLGAIGLHVNFTHQSGEIGYWIGVPFWGNGYATEAARAMIEYGFEKLRLNRIYASYFTRNPASRRVQEKAGLIFEGIHKQAIRKGDRYEDLGVCALIRENYQN